ncbi:MAG: response regulator [Pseudomonadota bacterium]
MAIANILLVDDETPFRETMTRRLTKREFITSSASGGHEAIRLLEENDYIEVVVLDVKMPEMDGLETLKIIRQKFPLVEVIMLSGHATIESAIEGMKLGAFDYLIKPCDMEELISKVSEAAKKRKRHKEKIIEAQLKEITMRRI